MGIESKENYELLTVKVKDFGVIKEGEVKLRPLTIFFGKNNTGKTYMGYLIWGMFNSHMHPLHFKFEIVDDDKLNNIISKLKSIIIDESFGKIQLNNRLNMNKNYVKRIFNYESMNFNSLELIMNKTLEYDVTVKKFPVPFDEKIEESNNEKLLMDFLNKEKIKNKMTNKLCIGIFEKIPWLMSYMVRGKDVVVGINDKMIKPKKKEFEMMLKDIILDISNILIRNTINNAIYLPASKSGLILSSGLFIDKLFKSPVVFKTYGESERTIDSEEEKLEFPEPVKDFMEMYLQPHNYNPDINKEYQDITQLFENNIIKGELSYDKDVNKLTYITKGNTVPFHCASSSVVETIPLLKLLKYSKTVKKGTLLIIEEPEAHLHPDAQRIFARAITKLTNKGVYVLLITHSPYILQQINNNIKLHYLKENMDEEEFEELLQDYGFDNFDVLDSKKVAPYLFVDEEDGVKIKELDINKEIGVSNEVFYSVMMELYEETANLKQNIECVKKLRDDV